MRNVSVGGFVKIPCGFNQIVGRIEGEIQNEQPDAIGDASSRTMGGASIERIVEISVFGVKRGDKFDRGITILPLVSSDVYVLAPEELALISSFMKPMERPFLRSSLRTAKKIATVANGKAYMAKMVKSFLEGYYGHEYSFAEQREDFVRCMALLVDKDNLKDAEEKVRETVEDIEIYTYNRPSPVLRIGGAFGDSAAELVNDVFELFNDIPKKPAELIADLPALVEFAVRFQFLQRWRAGSVAREHISSLIPRLESQMNEARKLYETVPGESLVSVKYPVKVFSLLNANQEQKKLVPLIIAKYAYREQRARGRKNPESSVHLIVDEAHNILSYSSQRESESWRDYRLETFEEIVKEGRKFGMYLTVSSQRPSDISPTIISQMHNYFIHRLVNDDDLNAIGKAASFIDRSTSSMIPVLPQGACIASGTAIPYPTQLQVGRMPTNRQPHSYDRDLAAAWGF